MGGCRIGSLGFSVKYGGSYGRVYFAFGIRSGWFSFSPARPGASPQPTPASRVALKGTGEAKKKMLRRFSLTFLKASWIRRFCDGRRRFHCKN